MKTIVPKCNEFDIILINRLSLLLCFLGTLLYFVLFSSLGSEINETSFYIKNINECERQLSLGNDIIEIYNNNNANEFGERLFYNRVPKCGSTTLYTVLRILSKRNRFKHYNSKIYNKRRLDFTEQEDLINELMRFSTPYSYDRHIYYIDFSVHKVSISPIYINLIRDPVDRIISSFYYRRAVAFKQNQINSSNKASDSWLNKSFESCFLTKDPECSDENWSVLSIIPYFCGQNDKCFHLNDEWALRAAKINIEKSFAVIGILEQMDITLKVMENKLPKFFAGVSDIYFENKTIHINENYNKQNVSKEVKSYLKSNLVNEYELYYYCLQRLYSQFNQIRKLN